MMQLLAGQGYSPQPSFSASPEETASSPIIRCAEVGKCPYFWRFWTSPKPIYHLEMKYHIPKDEISYPQEMGDEKLIGTFTSP